jgi:peroxiredoxin
MELNKIISICLFILALSLNAQDYADVDEVDGLAVGNQVDNFKLETIGAEKASFDELLSENEFLVIVFYRGQWCPVCNKHLSHLNENYTAIKNLDAQLLAVSPEKPDYQTKTQDKTGAKFLLGFDENYQLAKAFDVLYKPNAAKRSMYNVALGAKLKKAHSDESQRLPVPATFILNKDREIIWRQFDRNYKNRSTAEEILKALKDA